LAAQRFKLGRFFGIELFVHWSFGLLVAYVAYSTYVMGGSPSMVGFAITQLLAIFLCVTLHEYGHSLAARRYGVETVDITLLPIGGVARLKKIPRIPLQEFVIAVAGPLVNVVIVALLFTTLGSIYGMRPLLEVSISAIGFSPEVSPEVSSGNNGDLGPPLLDDMTVEAAVINFGIFLIVINSWLVLFNLVPAFPMDGGRVLRSILAMGLPYGMATRWAQRIGVVCAALMATIAISSDPIRWPMLLIAGFIIYAGQMEASQVELTDRFEGLTVRDVMSYQPPSVSIDLNTCQLLQWWQMQNCAYAAVVGLGNVVVGVISIGDLARHVKRAKESKESKEDLWRLTAGSIANHDVPLLDPSMSIETAIGSLQKYEQLPVVDYHHKLIGWVDFDTLMARAALSRAELTSSSSALLDTTAGSESTQSRFM